MIINTKFYIHNKGKYFECGGQLTIRNREIIKLGNFPIDQGGKSFYYDDTNFDITYQKDIKLFKVPINRIITESSYKTSQKEYLTRLNWVQQQKLLWMFKRHWLQQSGNITHLFITVIILSVAYFGIHYASSSF